ncbi:hypothetical protein ANO14919_105530 [Xylariales sp. No.14919]|nr:hypothetical protein ANO14919_105530 [Xylariales sp. No.14919]
MLSCLMPQVPGSDLGHKEGPLFRPRLGPLVWNAFNDDHNFRIIKETGAVATTDVLSRSVLHYSTQGGHLRAVRRIFKLFLELDVDTGDVDGWTSLCWAAKGATGWVSEDRASEPTDPVGVIRYLPERGDDRPAE